MSVKIMLRRLLRQASRQCRRHYASASENYSSDDSETHFGFQRVSEEEKARKVYKVFHDVAESYDLMNDVMSGGVHRLWKDRFMRRLAPAPGTQLIDVAGGTGDIAFRFLDYVKNKEQSDPSRESHTSHYDIDLPRDVVGQVYTEPELSEKSEQQRRPLSHVTVCDINQAMLDVGKKRAIDRGHSTGISWLKGNAECIPAADDTFDAFTIAYGIRNVTHVDEVLCEAYRVLRPGGRFLCLEFSHVNNSLFRSLYDQYSFQVIPVMGKVVAGDWHSYQYLVESIRQFPDQEEFSCMIREAGFRCVSHENLMGGVSAIHSAFKI